MRRISSPAHQADPVTVRARQLARRYTRQDNPSEILSGIIMFTLANWDKLESLYEVQIGYCVDEGLHPHDFWKAQITNQRRKK